MPEFRTITHTTRDGLKLKVSISQCPLGKVPSKIMLLAEPLGQCGPMIYSPIMTWYGPEFTYVTWDYRGFFGANLGKSFLPRLLSIPEHARDAEEVLRAAGFSKADVVVGHSMGTVVLFEMALLFPKSVGALVIMNGFHGHVYSTAFQPIIRLPFAGDCVSTLVELLLSRDFLLRTAFYVAKPLLKYTLPIYVQLFGSKLRRATEGKDYLLQFLQKYMDTITETPEHMERWLRMFQELDAHSVFHLLHTIKQPTLLISGYLDMLTPAMQSVEIARRIPHAIHYCDPFSSHATILESPEWALAEIVEFIASLKDS
jgi:pimeloyl-ACP methyl ester carboxylesterase